MNSKLPHPLLLRLSRAFAVKTAFHFPEERWDDLAENWQKWKLTGI